MAVLPILNLIAALLTCVAKLIELIDKLRNSPPPALEHPPKHAEPSSNPDEGSA